METKQIELLEKLYKDQLISDQLYSEIKLNLASTEQNIEDLLVSKDMVEPEKITEAKAAVYGLVYQNLSNKKISEEVIKLIPLEVAENYKIVCFDKEGQELNVGITDPDNFKAFEAVNFLAKEQNFNVHYFLISKASFQQAVKQYKNLSKEISEAVQAKVDEEAEITDQKHTEDQGKFEEVVESAPVAKIVSVVIRHAVEGGASDIHIEPLLKEARVRYRIDGVLKTSLILPKNIYRAVVARIKVLANMKLDETRIPQDGRIRQVINNKEVDFRVSVLPLVGEEKVVMRVLDVTKGAPTLEDLGFGEPGLSVIKKNIQKTNKLLLVTGPTGSGKSTTLYSILSMVNKEGVNISTLEDPVEYFLQGVNQSQIKPDIGYTFAAGLRSFLRQDPDIIMVGEIRDMETAELAIHASLTGHLVLSTMHTNDAFGAIPRLIDMKVEPFLLGSTLNTVVAQRLARKICKNCKIEEELPQEVLAEIKADMSKISKKAIELRYKEYDPEKIRIYKGKGCPRCGNTGYAGRVAVSEVIDVNEKIRDIIIENPRTLTMDAILASQEFISIKQDGIIKVLQGQTTMEEVFRVMRD
jgi:type IV pilus assembly protein PilB